MVARRKSAPGMTPGFTDSNKSWLTPTEKKRPLFGEEEEEEEGEEEMDVDEEQLDGEDDGEDDDDEEEEAIVPNTTFSTTAVEALQRASTERPQIGPEQWSPRPHPLVEEAFNIIMKVPHVRQALRFELVPFLERVHEHVLAAQNQSRQLPHPHCFDRVLRRMFGGGKCQSQKTPLKFCTVVMCRLMGVATVVLTTNTSGQRDLFGKLLKFVNGSNIPCQLSTQPSRVACLV
mmetsp:Transcript_15575/g.32980  ORF Transcript_15575/g.32980 Transcript_15575/m.32980 type:complete len:232 (+) Transcript_15575:271-966(+)